MLLVLRQVAADCALRCPSGGRSPKNYLGVVLPIALTLDPAQWDLACAAHVTGVPSLAAHVAYPTPFLASTTLKFYEGAIVPTFETSRRVNCAEGGLEDPFFIRLSPGRIRDWKGGSSSSSSSRCVR